jgi:hypothetical protein
MLSWPAGGVELPRGLIQFDIPAQPLAEAISTFSAVAGIEILVPADLLAQRQSVGVTGALTPEAALRALLSSTDLVPRGMCESAWGPGADRCCKCLIDLELVGSILDAGSQ